MHFKRLSTILPLVILILLLLVSGCTPTSKKSNDPDQPPLNPADNQKEKVSQEVTLYFGDDQAMYLVPEKRVVQIDSSKKEALLATEIVKELINGPRNNNLRPTIPPEAKLLSLEIKDGTAYVDFTEEIRTKHWGGSAGETMTITSLVNSLTELKGINRVQILINGKKQDSLVGHWYIGEPIERNGDIIKGAL
ncbi:GerMN domain-containing protein [Syntrophomonas erecta]